MIYSSPEEEIDLTNSPEAKREKRDQDQEAEIDLTNSPENLATTPEWAPVYFNRALQTDEVLKLFADPAKIDSSKVRYSLIGIWLLLF